MSLNALIERQGWAVPDLRRSVLFGCALLLVVVATLFGGASQTNALSLAAVELASLPLLMIAAYRIVTRGPPPGTALPLALLAAVVAVPILQLVPLPESIWSHLPGRGAEVRAVELAGLGRPALPYSLTPDDTWRAVLALLPPAAMFMGALLLPARQKRIVATLWLALALVDLVLGALQILGGQDSPLYFYAITNRGSPVGLFANRNHQAAFLYSLLPLAAVFVARMRSGLGERHAFPSLLAALFFPVAIVGVAATNSRAGVILLGASLLGSLAVAMRAGAFRGQWRLAIGLGIPGAVGVAAVLLFGLSPILDRFSQSDKGGLRFEGWPIVLDAAQSYLPLGAGIGAFDPVYRTVEPLEQVSHVFFNHAHNDYLELWLETGWAGAILLVVFLAWLARRAIAIWSSRPSGEDGGLAAAGTLVLLLLLAHSVVDYPLRTEAIATLFAFAAAAVARTDGPAPHRDGSAASDREPARRRRSRRAASGPG
ncbi:MAG: O-antigen ligase family protein [Caulobacteraceae bacterium]